MHTTNSNLESTMNTRSSAGLLIPWSVLCVLGFLFSGAAHTPWNLLAETIADDDSPQKSPSKGDTKQTIRERALAAYDADGDGRLNAAEREAIRKAGSPFAVERPVFRWGRSREDKAWVKKHDKDGDGKLNAEESRAARTALRSFWGELVQQYQAFKDDKPIVANLRKMERDAKSGKIKEFPLELYGWIRGSIDRAEREQRKSNGPRQSNHPLAKFDTNQNGILEASELKAIRSAFAKQNQPAPSQTP